jgi:hypothetical protein
LRDHKLYAKFSKCKFWLNSVKIFGPHYFQRRYLRRS